MLGKFIVFEGLNGCGKSTLLSECVNYFSHSDHLVKIQREYGIRQIFSTHEPGGSSLGKNIRKLLLIPTADQLIDPKAELLLFLADRAQHTSRILLPHLEKDIIFCDRFYPSTLAFQGLKGFDRNTLRELNDFACGLEPDLIIWLDCGIDKSMERLKTRGSLDRLDKYSEADLKQLQRNYEYQNITNPRFRRVEAYRDKPTVIRETIDLISKNLELWYPKIKQS